ncbi:MAG: TonB-dependent receptor [Caulobacterales bacterium]
MVTFLARATGACALRSAGRGWTKTGGAGGYLLSAGAFALAAALAAPASAQTDPSPKPAPAAATSAQGLGEIIVTAEKRSESVQRVPATVTAQVGEVLQRQGVKDLFQAITTVPGAVFSRAPDDGLALTFRGLGSTARPQAFDQSMAVFTDNVFNGKGRLYSAAFFDVDRIEFIKGAQSTLLGKNASLGAISIISRQPGATPSFEARAGYEAVDGGYSLDAAGDAPLSDKVSVRMAAHYNDLNGWVRNDLTHHNGPEHQDLGLRGILRADVTDSLTVTASLQYADNRQIGASYHLVGAIPPAYGPGGLTQPIDQFTGLTSSGDTFHRTSSEIASVTAEWRLGRFKVTSQTAYVGYDLKYIDDFDFSKDDATNFVRDETYDQATEELRIESPAGDRFEYMAGGFFIWSHWNSLENQLWGTPAFPPPPSPISGQLFNGPFLNHFVQDVNGYSAFASGVYHFTDAFRIAGGVRFTGEQKNIVYGRTAETPFTIWNMIANPPFDPTPLKHGSNFLDGDISLQYDLTATAMVYVSFGHGSKSGGYVETNTIAVPPSALVDGKVPPALVAAGALIKDEFSQDYEIGLKSTLFDRRLRFNIAAFWTDITDFQDTVFTGGPLGFITFNGPANSHGVEMDGAFQANQHLRFGGDLTFTDASAVIQPIDPTTNTPEVDASGNPIFKTYRRAQAPRIILDLNGDYETPLTSQLNLHLFAGLRYRSMMFNQRQNEFPSAALTTLDLSAGIQSVDEHWGLDLVAKNVTNAASQDFASPSVDPRFGAFYGAYLAGPNPGPTVTLSAHFKY